MSVTGALVRNLELFAPQPDDPLARRDPDFIRAELELLGPLTDAWFAPEVRGLEHVPDGAALLVGTHNGGNLAPDMFSLMVALWRRFGAERPGYGMAHDVVFAVPVIGRYMAKLGAVPARQRYARTLLERDAIVLVYPGGDLDAFKPFSARHQVRFGERTGFVRTALLTGAPIVPVVSVGAHETIYVVSDGRALARRLGLKGLTRIEVLPLIVCLPWGVWLGAVEGHVPVPSKVRIRVLPAMRFPYPPSAAADDAIVHEVRDEVRRAMQAALDELVAEGGYGPRERARELLAR